MLICWDLRKGTNDTMILPGRSREINVAIDPRISNVSMVLKLCANIFDSPPVPPRSTPCCSSLEESVGSCKAVALQELPETLAIVVFRFRLAMTNGRRPDSLSVIDPTRALASQPRMRNAFGNWESADGMAEETSL